MGFDYCPRRVGRSGAARAGFTLIELIVALSVMGVATSIFMRLYIDSMDLGKLANHRQIATEIARDQLALLALNPASFVWETGAANEQGVFRIRQTADEPRAGVTAAPPASMPPNPDAFEHQTQLYDEFKWVMFGKLSELKSYYEVHVDVRWTQKGKEQHVVMTGAVARGGVEPGWTEVKQ